MRLFSLLLFTELTIAFLGSPACGDAPPADPQQAAYADVKKLDQAIKVLKKSIPKSDLHYADLISTESVKAAIITSIRNVERDKELSAVRATKDKEREQIERSAKNFREVFTPALKRIVETSEWPKGAYFSYHSSPLAHSMFVVMLHIDASYELAPGLKTTGFAIQIVKIEFGTPAPIDDPDFELWFGKPAPAKSSTK